MNAFTLRTLALADARSVGRDPLLKWVLGLPLGLALALRVLMPRIQQALIANGFDIAPYFPLVMGGYLMTADIGDQESEQPGPYITLSLTSFASEEVARAVLDEADRLPVIAPGERVAGMRVPNTDGAVGYRFAFGNGTTPDSFRIVFVVGATLAAVEVWASPAARAETLDLTLQQVACLASDEPCETVRIPASLWR